ncbi:MAG: hypothetical protein IT293_13190 [Deltaproteobacteria bacterium]|nr:hypothetical protein [Deltaproteobacteria bacterium]
MTPTELFDPNNMLATSGLAGPDGARVLLEAGKDFPGGPIGLVFALFWAPVGPGIPAGVLLARHIPLHPAATFGLYAASDVLAAAICHPLFVGFKRLARHVPALRRVGKGMLKLAMLGTPAAHGEARGAASSRPAALFRVATIGFGVDVYTAGAVATGLDVPRVLRWLCAIAGDLVWFAILLATSVVAASFADDDRVVGGVVLLAMLIVPSLARRLFPALRV